uniref:K Homology domain-containing protein n=1 Tax=viral metagenome TaxID=1070528 RepID=A0A6C0F8H4_9ZZZZ|tara:strand:+ start:3020 stop:3298 length:279 start_codon:yes stop_codon:yes gene_type:complete
MMVASINVSEYSTNIILHTMGFRGINFKNLKTSLNLSNIWWNQDCQEIFIYGNKSEDINRAKLIIEQNLSFNNHGNIDEIMKNLNKMIVNNT